jgi:hypothetical protein
MLATAIGGQAEPASMLGPNGPFVVDRDPGRRRLSAMWWPTTTGGRYDWLEQHRSGDDFRGGGGRGPLTSPGRLLEQPTDCMAGRGRRRAVRPVGQRVGSGVVPGNSDSAPRPDRTTGIVRDVVLAGAGADHNQAIDAVYRRKYPDARRRRLIGSPAPGRVPPLCGWSQDEELGRSWHGS